MVTDRILRSSMFLLVLEAACLGQLPAPQLIDPSSVLKKDKTDISSEFAFGFYGPVVCDGEGNIYFRMSEWGMNRSPIRKLTSKGEHKADFTVPSELMQPEKGKAKFAFYDYTVDPDGSSVYILGQDGEKQYLLRFDADGKFQNKTMLSVPTSVQVEHVAVFRSGEIFVTGHFDQEAGKELGNKGYAAVLKADGSLIKRISTNIAKNKPEDDFDAGKLNAGYAIPSTDGNIYNLRSNRIVVISPSGEIVRTMQVEGPIKDYSPNKLHISSGVLSVEFVKVNAKHRLEPLFRTYNSDGIFMREYVPGPELGNSPLCFSLDDGFTFYGNENGKVKVMHASIR